MARAMSFVLVGGSVKTEKLGEVAAELVKGSDRAVAIVGGALIETALTNALTTRFHQNEKIMKDLFHSSGALGAFGTKIHLSYLTGLCGPQAHRELVTIKDIRNAFAHSLEVNGFNYDKMKGLTANLKLCERYAVDQDTHRPSEDQKKIDFEKTPHRDWPAWVFVPDLKGALADPRERFLVTMQVFMWGLSIPRGTVMPEPIFY